MRACCNSHPDFAHVKYCKWYRGNILACKVVHADERSETLMLALPPAFADRETFETTEKPEVCVKCKATYINHWNPDPEFYPNECAPCAGVRVFPWAACILEWDQESLDKTAASR